MLRRLTRSLVLAGALALSGYAAQAQEKVVVGLPGAPWSVQFGYYAFGEQLGFFKEEGMVLEYISVSGSAVLLPQVAAGQVHFGYANPDLAVIALAKGEPLPVKFVANWLRSQTFEFVALTNSPVTKLADLKGRKLGVGALTFGNIPLSKAMLASSGVTWSKDVEILPVGVGPAAWRRLETGEIDALNLFVGEHARMEMAGIPIKRLPMPDQFRTIFSNGIVTSNTLVEQKPKLVAGFGRALVKSWLACKENTEACVRAYWKANASARPAPDKEAEQLKRDMAQVMFDRNQIDDFTVGGASLYGFYPEDAWKRLVGVMAAEGQIQRADLDLSKLFTNQFAEEYNKFDRNAVIEAAKAAK
jgi:NitT/TauT family transport system substrate-binding protein